MHTLSIPNTGLTPSALCLGCGNMGLGLDRAASFAMLDAWSEAGGNFLDTAKVYSDWVPGESSRSEKMIGEWLKARRNRQQVIVATKGAHPELTSMHIPRMSPAEITGDLEASLRHLQIDTIDLYWLHRDDRSRPVAEILETLAEQARAGKVRYYACSNWRADRLIEAQKYAAEHGLPGFAGTQVMWNLARVNYEGMLDKTIVIMDTPLWEVHQRSQLAAIPFTSQANGLFQKLAAGGPENLSPQMRALYWNPTTEQRFTRLKELHKETGFTITQLALGYLINQPFPTIPVFSARNQAQLADSLSAADVRLTPEQIAYLRVDPQSPGSF